MRDLAIPKAIKKKIDVWHQKNEEFKQSLIDNDRVKVESLLEDGYPFYLHKLLTQEEISQIGDAAYDDLTDDFYKDLSDSLEKIYLAEEKRDMLELLATYLMFQDHDISFKFRKNYFCYTNNYDDAIKYAETLINTFGFLKAERSSWLLGALYNENDEFFDAFYAIYEEFKEYNQGVGAFTLTGKILDDGKYYNINSWKKHFVNHFPSLAEKRYRSNEKNDVDVYSVIILELIKYPLEIFENGSEQEKQKVKPIIDFLLDDFSSITDIEKLDYMLVAILFERERELLWELNHQAKNSANTIKTSNGRPIAFRRQFKSLILETSLTKNREELNSYIEKSITKNAPEECLDFFKRIGLPKDRYQVLENYVSLSKSAKSEEKELANKKSSKI